MFDDGRGDEDRRVGGKLDRNLEVPEYEVTAFLVVVRAEARHGTPTPAEVLEVFVRDRADLRAEVEGRRPKRAVSELASQVWAVAFDQLERPRAERVELNGVPFEGLCVDVRPWCGRCPIDLLLTYPDRALNGWHCFRASTASILLRDPGPSLPGACDHRQRRP